MRYSQEEARSSVELATMGVHMGGCLQARWEASDPCWRCHNLHNGQGSKSCYHVCVAWHGLDSCGCLYYFPWEVTSSQPGLPWRCKAATAVVPCSHAQRPLRGTHWVLRDTSESLLGKLARNQRLRRTHRSPKVMERTAPPPLVRTVAAQPTCFCCCKRGLPAPVWSHRANDDSFEENTSLSWQISIAHVHCRDNRFAAECT